MQIDRPITIALILFIILLLVFFLLLPEYNTFQTLQMQLGEKRAEYAAQVDYYAAIAATYASLQQHQDDIKKIDDALPQDPGLGKLIYFLQTAAKDNSLIVKDLFLSNSSLVNSGANTTSSVKDMIFSIDLSGNYQSLEGFIVSLENSSRIFEVTSISFASASGPPYNFNLQIKTHSY